MKIINKILLGVIFLIVIILSLGIRTVLVEGNYGPETGIFVAIIGFLLFLGYLYRSSSKSIDIKSSNFTSPKNESPITDKAMFNYEDDHPLKVQDEFVKSNLNLSKLHEDGILSEKEYKEKLKLLIGKTKENDNSLNQEFKKNKSINEFNKLVEEDSKGKIESVNQLFKNKVFSKKECDLKLEEIRQAMTFQCLKKHGISLLLMGEIRNVKIGDILKIEILDENLYGNNYKDFTAVVSYVNLLDFPNIVVWNSKVGLFYKFNSALCTFIKHDKFYESKFNPKNYLDFKNNVLQ